MKGDQPRQTCRHPATAEPPEAAVLTEQDEPMLMDSPTPATRAPLDAIFQSINDGIAVFDMQGNLVLLNDALARINGYSSPAEMRRHLDYFASVYELRLPDDTLLPTEQWPISRALRGETFADLIILGRRHDTGRRWCFSFSGVPVFDEHGQQILAVINTRDITERMRLQDAANESNRRLEMAVSIAQLGFWEWDQEKDTMYLSPEWKRQIGFTEDELNLDRAGWLERIHPADRDAVNATLAANTMQKDQTCSIEYRLLHRDGSYRHMLANTRPGKKNGAHQTLTGTQLDVTENRQSQQRILEAARHDALTGLPNRNLVFEHASHMLAAARRQRNQGAVLFIDLDRFKPVNDLYGHDTGDLLLQHAARRIRKCVREEDILGRLGGDEFIILIPHLANTQLAGTVAQHVIDALKKPFHINGLALSISASVGISQFPRHGTDLAKLIQAADTAMYQSKQSGRSCYHYYEEDLNSRSQQTQSVESRLKRAMRGDGLMLHYQPVFNIYNGSMTGVEALLRMNSDDPLLATDNIIRVAEAAGLINHLGEWVVQEVLRQQAGWQQQGLPWLPVAINISPLQFRQRAFASTLIGLTRDACSAPGMLQVEVTEACLMENTAQAHDILSHLEAAGIGTTLDDFGAGSSSLRALSRLPLNKLKVDHSFVRQLHSDRAARVITDTIIAMARALDLQVVGEGIENEETLLYLRNHGCDQAQGFHLCRPLDGDSLRNWFLRTPESLKPGSH